MKKKKFWSIDRVVTFSAISISLFTLIVFMRQTSIIEKQSRLSALPYLYVETGLDPEEKVITITINNYGVGPAIIESMLIFYDGNTYDDGLASFMKEDIFKMDSINIVSSTEIRRGYALPAGTDRILAKIGGTDKQFLYAQMFMEKLGDIDSYFEYQITYKSIYDDKWKIHLSNETPVKL